MWHVSPVIDVMAYHLSWAWILIPLALVGNDRRLDYPYWFALVLALNFAHRHYGFPYAYLDRDVFRTHPPAPAGGGGVAVRSHGHDSAPVSPECRRARGTRGFGRHGGAGRRLEPLAYAYAEVRHFASLHGKSRRSRGTQNTCVGGPLADLRLVSRLLCGFGTEKSGADSPKRKARGELPHARARRDAARSALCPRHLPSSPPSRRWVVFSPTNGALIAGGTLRVSPWAPGRFWAFRRSCGCIR